jgi:hypothetical protein
VRALIVYSALAAAAAAAAYYALFVQFAAYDDEGTLLVTVKAFAEGDTLYRDVYAIYGPFYYEIFGAFFAGTGIEITTEISRTIVIFFWVGASLLYGLTAHRLTGRLALGVVGTGSAFGTLYVLQSEPMHPQIVCVVLLAAFALLAAFGPGRRPARLGALAGAVLAALVLTKLNLGAFAVAAVVVAAVLAVEPLRRRRWLVALVCLGWLVLPFLVMQRDLEQDWTRELVLIEMLAMAAVLVVSRPFGTAREADAQEGPTVRWLLGAVAGFAVAFIAILIAILLTGSSAADVWDGVVTQALRVRDVLVSPLYFPAAAVDWALAALAAASLVTMLRPTFGSGPSLWSGGLRALAGLGILATVGHIAPFSLGPSSENPVVIPVILAWVAAVPLRGVTEPTYKRFLRVLLPALAVGEALQVYPVAGSQMGIAASTFVPAGALCLADALAEFRAWSAAQGGGALRRFGIVTVVVSVALAAQFTLDSMLRSTVEKAIVYGNQEAMPFKGTAALHLPPEEVERYSRLVDLIKKHRCTTFISYPNVDSLYLWTGIEAPAPKAPGAWMNALDDERQQRVVDEMKTSPRPCAIRNDVLAEGWLQGKPPPDAPLVNYVFNGFRPIEEVGDYTFMLPRRIS